MDIRKRIETELERQSEHLEFYRSLDRNENNLVLKCKNVKGRSRQFFYRKKGDKKVKYIGRKDKELVTEIFRTVLCCKTISILEHNILLLKRTLTGLRPYDPVTVMETLPSAYKEAAEEYMIDTGTYELPQDEIDTIDPATPSENPYKREELKYPVSNGIKVRSKSEALICEYLLAASLIFRYEKALDLVYTYTDEAGFEHSATERIYPDFTIYLPDGTIIYWEHEGRMDDERYRKRNLHKMMLYYRNGIYMPTNLIITMEGDCKVFDTDAVQRIINGFIKPVC